jgi:hypothetical protein
MSLPPHRHLRHFLRPAYHGPGGARYQPPIDRLPEQPVELVEWWKAFLPRRLSRSAEGEARQPKHVTQLTHHHEITV